MIGRFLLILLSFVLAGCGSSTFNDIGRAPTMSPMGSGLRYGQTPQMALYPKPPRKPGNGYSLWTDAQSDLFKDARAMSVGDILTVNIAINDKATFDNATDRDRTNSSGINAGGSYAVNGSGSDGEFGLTFGSNTSTEGKGTTARSETLELRVAAVVTGVLDNGNLVISGSQEVRVNYEMRILNIAGIVRPRDVDAYNTIAYEKIAEARVSYGGRGRLMEVQQPPVGQQIVDIYSPI
ncbi:flagellar basal body L-ring protein FlgH [Nitratireductor sp. XY-223]|uniref:flagellar basal body L-ring protein FlgH n=1 Tax=Nitratireductor sp. XY-223 TaxID=2561926 RepID=UPI0010AA1218|nr:flagellar basal body L-ring protein FlgH [Nitratireductor sp. XY-223]